MRAVLIDSTLLANRKLKSVRSCAVMDVTICGICIAVCPYTVLYVER